MILKADKDSRRHKCRLTRADPDSTIIFHKFQKPFVPYVIKIPDDKIKDWFLYTSPQLSLIYHIHSSQIPYHNFL